MGIFDFLTPKADGLAYDPMRLPAGADPENDPVVGYDELGQKIRRSRFDGTQYLFEMAPPKTQSVIKGAYREATANPLGFTGDLLSNAVQSAWDAISVPRRAMEGQPLTYGDIAGLTGMMTLGAGAGTAPAGALRMGAAREGRPPVTFADAERAMQETQNAPPIMAGGPMASDVSRPPVTFADAERAMQEAPLVSERNLGNENSNLIDKIVKDLNGELIEKRYDKTFGSGNNAVIRSGDTDLQIAVREDETGIYLTNIASKKAGNQSEVKTGSGVGSRAIEALKRYSDETGKPLAVVGATGNAQKFYEKMGLKPKSVSTYTNEGYITSPSYGPEQEGTGFVYYPSRVSESSASVDTSYRMQHQPRGPQEENPIRLDDLTKSTKGEQAGYPADFYSANGPRYYAPGPQFAGDEFGRANRESYRAIASVKGKPDAEVTIYRAVPNDPNINTINEGDFVTLSETYAKLHGASGYGRMGDEPGKIISQKVKVRDIYFDGNDVNEFGYFPVPAGSGPR